MTQLKKPVQIYHEIINEEPIVEVPKHLNMRNQMVGIRNQKN